LSFSNVAARAPFLPFLGVQAMIDVCRQSSYGYDQRAEVLGSKGMIATDNVYPNTAKIFKNGKQYS
jgi:hypothetical protein